MAKIKHNHFLDTVDEIISKAKRAGILHLKAEDTSLNGRYITINGIRCYHFGTTGYLGLEQDSRLKKGAIDAIKRYGTQFPLSKTYISHPLYAILENQIKRLYGYPIIITKNSTLGHIAVIPSVVMDDDVVLLDHQVHWSVQNAAQILKLRGVTVRLVRHNNLEMLEDMIKKYSSKAKKIWYMADGVYSMFGDYAPVQALLALAKQYTQLHLYFDDVHGMSWQGKHGSGYVMSQMKSIPHNVLIFGTLSKTFGASGAVLVCPDKDLYHRIKNFGGPLTFSAQLEPSAVGAAIASAQIHLSTEIYTLQDQLKSRIDYFNTLLSDTDLPLVSKNDSPVFFIGTGLPATGHRLVKKLIDNGYFVNLGLYPAVPVKNTGVRITISIHNDFHDIKNLCQALEQYHSEALIETGNTNERIAAAFGLSESTRLKAIQNRKLKLRYFESINQIDVSLWNETIGQNNMMDWKGVQFLEEVFQDTIQKEHHWNFHYIHITDRLNKTIVLGFLTDAIWKDDMLSTSAISKAIEKQRLTDPYIHTSRVLGLGSIFTEGKHIYVNRDHPIAEEALREFLIFVEKLGAEKNVSMTVLRDFEPNFSWSNLFLKEGFFSIDMPDSSIVTDLDKKLEFPYIHYLSKRSQKHFKKDIEPHENLFNINILQKPSPKRITTYYELYKQVKERNLAINTFTYPIKLFKEMAAHPNWEYIELALKSDKKILGVMFCYKNVSKKYVPNLIGMDYRYARDYHVYRQLLYQTVKRAKALGFNQIDFGFSASFEKRKIGATTLSKKAYVHTNDNFMLEQLEMMRSGK